MRLSILRNQGAAACRLMHDSKKAKISMKQGAEKMMSLLRLINILSNLPRSYRSNARGILYFYNYKPRNHPKQGAKINV